MPALAIDRRSLIRSGALAATALAVPGCVTTPRTALSPTSCLPPVKVDSKRIIRTVAGLRPYRDSGFVVRAEPLADKRLVHNYGHGGAGITLSWGSSKLATDLGLQGHNGGVAVIGAGVMGLSTARLVQEAGFPVTIYAKELPPHTTSNVAGGQISPFGHFREDSVTPEWRRQFMAAMEYSWRRFQIMVGDDYGIRWLTTFEQSRKSTLEPHPLDPYWPNARMLRPSEHPLPLENVIGFDAMYVETGRYLRQMLLDFQTAGGAIRRRSFESLQEIAELPEALVFNCTGIGARALFNDQELRPVRGQLAVLLPQPEIRYAATGEWGYMFPRADGILLGGTFERDEWDTTPNPADIARILSSHARFFSGFRCTA